MVGISSKVEMSTHPWQLYAEAVSSCRPQPDFSTIDVVFRPQPDFSTIGVVFHISPESDTTEPKPERVNCEAFDRARCAQSRSDINIKYWQRNDVSSTAATKVASPCILHLITVELSCILQLNDNMNVSADNTYSQEPGELSSPVYYFFSVCFKVSIVFP